MVVLPAFALQTMRILNHPNFSMSFGSTCCMILVISEAFVCTSGTLELLARGLRETGSETNSFRVSESMCRLSRARVPLSFDRVGCVLEPLGIAPGCMLGMAEPSEGIEGESLSAMRDRSCLIFFLKVFILGEWLRKLRDGWNNLVGGECEQR